VYRNYFAGVGGQTRDKQLNNLENLSTLLLSSQVPKSSHTKYPYSFSLEPFRRAERLHLFDRSEVGGAECPSELALGGGGARQVEN
jgi:hypothetical protein